MHRCIACRSRGDFFFHSRAREDAGKFSLEAQVHATVGKIFLLLHHSSQTSSSSESCIHILCLSSVNFVKLSIVTAAEPPDFFCPVCLAILGSCSVDSSHCRRLGRPKSWHLRAVTRHGQSRDYRDRANWCRRIAYSLVALSDAHLRRQTRRPSARARPPPWHPVKGEKLESWKITQRMLTQYKESGNINNYLRGEWEVWSGRSFLVRHGRCWVCYAPATRSLPFSTLIRRPLGIFNRIVWV